ncbi:MAG: hypothetical protein GKR95_09375 [Gammaproteobacteria bacterium]|nr:hypothetical protein [Gammaproteobacteria bacterium]
MKIDIYKSTIRGDKYLSVLSGTDVSELKLPEDTDTDTDTDADADADADADMLSLSPFKTSVELDANRNMIGLDQEDIKNQIESRGYAMHRAAIISNTTQIT